MVPSEEDGQTFSVNFASGEVNTFSVNFASGEVNTCSVNLFQV